MERPAGQVNQHRGLRLGALKRRYQRVRYQEPEDGGWSDDDDPPRWFIDHCCDRPHDLNEEGVLTRWAEDLRNLGGAPTLGDVLPGPRRAPSPRAAPRAPRLRLSPDQLIEALHEHLATVGTEPECSVYLQDTLSLQALRHQRDEREALRRAARRLARQPEALLYALLLAPFWVRPLASWAPAPALDASALDRSLMEHLFVVYPVPGFLHSAWEVGQIPRLKWVCWTVLLGQGASLHKAAPRFGWSVSGRLLAQLLRAPAELPPLRACQWAEITRLGGSPLELARLQEHFRFDPTDEPSEEAPGAAGLFSLHGSDTAGDADQRAFFRDTVTWFVRHRDQLSEAMVAPILDWALHLRTEGRFAWSGRTVSSAREQALAYQRERLRPYTSIRWLPRGWDWELTLGELRWSVRELTSGLALYEEGQAMRHCVSGYAHRCARGECAIFSLCRDGQRRLTVEIDPRSRSVRQARGACNRAATHEENDVLRRWLQRPPQ